MKTLIIVIFLSLFFCACTNNSEEVINEIQNNAPIESKNTSTNILFIIADDMGLATCPGYDLGNVKPNMSNLKKQMDSGIRFNNLWPNPTCSPTRAGIITGKYGFRNGVLAVDQVLSTSEITLQNYINSNTSAT